MCSLGNRQSVHGILFNGSFASFWCFDRGGGVFTHECNIDRDFPDLIRCLMSLCLANNTELGLEPMFQQSGVKDVELFGSVLQRYLVVQRSLFTISKTLHITSELDGRGTTVFKVITAPDGRTTDEVTEAGEETVIPEAAVIKFSWQSTSQALEIALFRRAQEFNVEGIATLYRYSSPRKLSDGHRKQLGLKVGIDYVDRELHVQVTGPVCIPLYRVVDEDDFAAAFKSLISAHHSLYKKAGILHRDISINNLMVDETNPQRGVLIDLDLAIQVRDGERVLGIRPSTVGTYPFLALDLFRDEPLTQRWYRHDLESFLYVLAWILSRFDEDGNEVHQTAAFDDWIFGEKKYIFLAKRGFLREAERFRPVRFSRLQKSWMPELGALFYSGYNFRAKCIAGLVPYEDETLGGFVTFETVMEQLQKPLPEPEIDATVQLVPEPGTIISFNVPERPPPAHPGTITANISVTGLTPWEIYDRFDDGLKAALASKDLTDVNDALAKFSVPEAEKIVELLQCSEILRVEDSTHDER
ncbi:uncharacterized protein EI90DRAFT_3028147 [Cantharellus anzutake]|uniref:uncharacterized protein n=1 Tax=Cantharellus anzutake TaxID=1750568 RepID=UPI00190492D5|nr:uncharacterized protein EI90DRAFT_3028147 [Cantharellus anzutake]KAF8344063.1 hypothetical protein EI90DRAFT_3028147 [Cantharellus anzutake]